jgi:hypothetical protein
MKLTTVSMELLSVDYKVLALMSDETVVTLSTPWGMPTEAELRTWRFRTKDELTTLAQNHNCDRKHQQWERVHYDKVHRFGWDYRSRGY